jgi:seryl-tRNA synthetase
VLDLRLVRERPDALRDALARRGALGAHAADLERLDGLERDRRALIQQVEERKAARNAGAQEVARRKRAGESADDLIARGRALGDEIAALDARLAAAEGGLHDILLGLPNVTLADVPAGGEECNVVVRAWGEPRAAGDAAPHWEAGARLGVFDLERAAKVSGSGFAVYRGRGARLVRALLNYFVDTHVAEHGYEEVWAPALVTRATMTGTGQLPKFEDDAYAVRGDDLFLIPTAEVPVTNLYRDEVLDGADLPRGFVAYTPCFRREAGSAGKDTRGIQRLHQFDKVELVRYSTPEDSAAQLELLTGHAEALLRRSASRTASCSSRRATPASRARRPTTSRSSRPASGSGSRCRAARCSATSRPGAPTSGTARLPARSRASSTRSTGRASPSRA